MATRLGACICSWVVVILAYYTVHGVTPEVSSVALTADRTLNIRSIPAVPGYSSRIYEVPMSPYLKKKRRYDSPRGAIAELRSEETVLGDVQLQDEGSHLKLLGTISGLNPNQQVGISVHENGDCRKLGPIFRPDQPVGSPPSPETPAGFLGTMQTDKHGRVYLNIHLGPRLGLMGYRSVLARGIALYDMSATQQNGTSTHPLACGVLGRMPLPSAEEENTARRRRHYQSVIRGKRHHQKA